MDISGTAEFTPERIAHLAGSINGRLSESIQAIEEVNEDIHVLSVNAKIQAARAGHVGAGFGVVADEIRKLVSRTQSITADLDNNVRKTVAELTHINRILQTKVRGQRLAQVAATCIDIVDRNLYERSCDVRWWATEDALVQALVNPDDEHCAEASKRLGVILDSYTVYLDLVLCDLDGTVLANGRKRQFASVGKKVNDRTWYGQALRSRSGTEYGFEGVHQSALVNNKSILVYSCAVRKDGDTSGEPIGVLGILFNWASLSEVVVAHAEEMLAPETSNPVSAYLCYPDSTVIASSNLSLIGEPLPVTDYSVLFKSTEDYQIQTSRSGTEILAGRAVSKGFETYHTGWYAVIVEQHSR